MVRFTYNLNGQVTNREDGNNVDTVYVYDEPDGGLSKIDYASGTDTEFDYDDYGNETAQHDFGVIAGGNPALTYDDERFTTTSYALLGDALANWIIGLPDTITVTDENGAFVSRTMLRPGR